MASGKDLKRRIASVKSTQQITKAMKMVAAARLRRAQEAILRARPFAAAIKGTVQNLVHSDELRGEHALLTAREVKRVNVILLTSDRGLCGGFNSSLMKRAEAMYKAEAPKYEKLSFTCFGKKGYEFLTLRKIPVEKNYPDFYKGLTYAKVNAVADDLIESFVGGEFDEIRVLFAEFRSAISQVVTTTTILPIQVSQEPTEPAGATDFLFEPSRARVLESLLPRYFKAKLYNAFLESQASEHGARMAAMDNATKNAGELIRKLTLEYNKVRQASITKELLEIVSGAEALK
jgi:F-type H+-transporting ATPase subunit gamma